MCSSISPGARKSPSQSSAPGGTARAGRDLGDASVADDDAARHHLAREHEARVREHGLARLRDAGVVWHGTVMSEWRRHAIYFAPPQGSALARFGAAWLGWDPEAGVETEGPELAGLPRPRAELTAAPARYGFHATLKAPFRLAEGCGAAALDAATAAVAAGCRPFELRLRLGALGAFLALVPEGAPPALAGLERGLRHRARPLPRAADGGRARPPWRGPRGRRGGAPRDLGLPLRARALPLPHDADRSAASARTAATRAALAPLLTPLLAEPLPVREICRFAEAADGRFRLVARFPLG